MAIPLDIYFSRDALEREKRTLLRQGGGFVGLTNQVPDGGFFVPRHLDDAAVMLRAGSNISLLSNLCSHRQAILLRGSGKIEERITCPVHKWQFDREGRFVSGRGFSSCDDFGLEKIETLDFRGFITCDPKMHAAVSAVPAFSMVDFSDFVLSDYVSVAYPVNWKEYMDVYLDNYHVQSFHPGLRTLVDITSLRWETGERFVSQYCGFNRHFFRNPGSVRYREYAEALARHFGDPQFEFGAVWTALFPNVIVEMIQAFLLVGVMQPIAERESLLHFFSFARRDVAANDTLVRAFNAAMDEAEEEDAHILRSISDGRFALWRSGKRFGGSRYHEPEEAGMRLWHEFLVADAA
jgi:phenylpropionate dioxygenase-like ring-hydroxylating dioxygenase large terminal subunit